VRAKAARQTADEGDATAVRFSEFSKRSVSRRFELPDAIDIEKVAAKLDKGILEITAAKGAVKGKAIAVEA
jgi:HSP20 family molecular chaperone IbpA